MGIYMYFYLVDGGFIDFYEFGRLEDLYILILDTYKYINIWNNQYFYQTWFAEPLVNPVTHFSPFFPNMFACPLFV